MTGQLTAFEREQLAAQIVALMKAVFHKPEPPEMESILDLAKQQIAASRQSSTFQSLG